MSKSLRTVESVIAELADTLDVTIDLDPRVRWALLDDHSIGSLVDWVEQQGHGRMQHMTARITGPGRMLLVQAELRGNVAAICVLGTHMVGESTVNRKAS